MKKFILAILFFCGAFTVQSEPTKASGATVVFLQVRFPDYSMTSAIRDKIFNSSELFNVLESSQRGLYVSRVSPDVYRLVSYYTSLGYDFELRFEKDQNVTFRYYPQLKAIIGVTEDQEIIVLLPITPSTVRPQDGTKPSAVQGETEVDEKSGSNDTN